MQSSARPVPKPPLLVSCEEDAEEIEPGRWVSGKFNKGGAVANCWMIGM